MTNFNGFGRIAAVLAASGFLLVFPGYSRGDTANQPARKVTDSDFESYVLKSARPVLVDFGATWCGPCRKYGPVVDQVAEEYKGRLKVVRVDVDQNPSLCRDYRVQYLPTSFLFLRGKPVHRWLGVVSQRDLEKEIEAVLQKVGKE